MRLEAIENDRIFLIHDFLSPDECERHIARSEAVGYETFTIDGEVLHGYRDNGRVIVDDPDLADVHALRNAAADVTILSLPAMG